ncbi:hypothetical protein FOZ62_020953, partial [Perkinsus olseni]
MGRPKLTPDSLFKKWAAEYNWLEWRAHGIDGIQFRCRVCARNPLLERGQLQKTEEARLEKLEAKRDLVKCAFWLAQEEVAIAKFPSLLKMITSLSKSTVDATYHSSAHSAWSFLESADVELLHRDVEVLKSSQCHCIILDSTSEDVEWLAVLARCFDTTDCRDVKVVFWDLLHVSDTKSHTIVDAVLELYDRDSVDIRSCVGWASDGCSAMVKASKVFSERAGIDIVFLHCLAHRLDLCLSSDVWKSSSFCKDVERALRISYCLFNRSPKRREELLGLRRQFAKVLVPGPLMEIRWTSKLRCLEAFVAGGQALSAYILQLNPGRELSTDENHVVDMLERSEDLNALLSVLRVLGKLTVQLQSRTIDVFAASQKINSAVRDLRALPGLSEEITPLRDDLVDSLSSRIPPTEFSWMGLLELNVEFPKAVVIAKLNSLKEKLPHVASRLDEETFYRDYQEVRGQYQDLVTAGADARTISLTDLSKDK